MFLRAPEEEEEEEEGERDEEWEEEEEEMTKMVNTRDWGRGGMCVGEIRESHTESISEFRTPVKLVRFQGEVPCGRVRYLPASVRNEDVIHHVLETDLKDAQLQILVVQRDTAIKQ